MPNNINKSKFYHKQKKMPGEDFYVSPTGFADGAVVTFRSRSSALLPILRHCKYTAFFINCITFCRIFAYH